MEDPTSPLALRLQPDASRYTLPAFLDDVAARHGERPALRFGGREWSFGALRREARRVAAGLVGAGVGKGSRVALLLGNRPEWVIAAFGASLAGALVVPVNTFATPEERDAILRHSDASMLLLQRSLLRHAWLEDLVDRHPSLTEGRQGRMRCAALPSLRSVFCLGLDALCGAVETWEELLALGDDVPSTLLDALAEEITPADDALLIYTSGTTALPKGVLHAQRAAVVQSWRFAELMGLGPEDVVLTAQPFFWTAGLAMSLGASLAAGATLVLQEVFDAGAALAAIERERVTALFAWPHQEKAMAEHPDARRRDLGSLRKIEFRSPLAPLVGLEKDEWGTYGSYGLSETFTLASALPASAPPELRAGTSGRPLPGMRLRVVDPVTNAPLPPGGRGEIAVQGATFMRGYYKVEPEAYLDEEGYFHTQDGGWVDEDGYLHWTGRLSNLIKTGGANVAPLEIEAALGSVPGLRAAVALGVPHPTLGEAVVLCGVLLPGARPDAAGLLEQLRGRLAAYKVPRHVLFLREDEVEYTGSQKIQPAALRKRALAHLARERVEIAGHRYGASG